MAEHKVTFYPTYGHKDGDNWVISIRIWVHERRALVEQLITNIAASIGNINSRELANFRSRIQHFALDSESLEAVSFTFDDDPENQEFRSPKDFLPTDLNGLVEKAVIKLSTTKAQTLLSQQGSQNGWLTYRATSKDHSGTGRVQLIEPTGLSVVSDIDDTIKITDIPAGLKVVVRNTFFHDFVAAPEMAEKYQRFNEASFHYVSGSPWQLHGLLSEFLFSEQVGFPEGTFHMRQVTKNVFSANTWKDLKAFVPSENATFKQKVSQITDIMRNFPGRQFILVGDSGETDPEVYREIRKRFFKQVREIMIRDVINAKKHNNVRLEDMTIIDPAFRVR